MEEKKLNSVENVNVVVEISDFLTPKEVFKSPSVDLFKLARISL